VFIKQEDSLEKVILVDSNDHPLGGMDKLQAHQQGLLHRAFSVFIFNNNHQLLIQKRAEYKYHSPNEWANTCCGHPREHENIADAAHRRLFEEMGMSASLTKNTAFIYQAPLANGLIEHEFVHFFTGRADKNPVLNPYEVGEYLWISKDQLFFNSLKLEFAPWFKIYLNKYEKVIDAMFLTATNHNVSTCH
jgi:isopentenyl-diphosphate delta-isomerase